jgi:hypothetical protein
MRARYVAKSGLDQQEAGSSAGDLGFVWFSASDHIGVTTGRMTHG